ncbi:TonB-dependent receptor [Weeksellaceae bacterium TAE3-ERU29]|nr:TonB-dependent receptor [Weeksellaceae bacterium TAE3-ERU29]
MKKFSFFTLFVLASFLFSQEITIKGKVRDEQQLPIVYAEVLLKTEKDSLLSYTFSNDDGTFNFSVKKSDELLVLNIEHFGQKLFTQNISPIKDIDLGTITVNNTLQLETLVAEGKKKLIQRKVDRLVFNVENSVSALGGDALDALRVTPGLRIQNEQISIIGKSGVSVMIDDKLVQLSGDDLVSFLRTINSDNIKSIEVITTPPAKYDAQGNSGIVNIKLKQPKKDNISGNLKTSYTQATHPLGSLGGGLNYQKDKLTVTSNVNYSNGSIAPYQEYTINYPNYTWFEKNEKRIFLNSLSGRVALDYKVSPKTTMGIQYLGALSKPIYKVTNTSHITKNNVLDSLIITPSRLESQRKTHSLNFNSTTKVDTIGTQYAIDIDYFKFKSNLDNNFSTNTYFADNTPVANRYISANNLSAQDIDIYTAKFDYEMPLKWINLSFGTKVSFINNSSQVSYFDKTKGNPIFDSSKSNVFNYKENTQALYVSGSKKLSEKWDLKLGLRLENTQTKGYSETLNQTNKNNYLKLFPTFYITYQATENSTWGLNYSRRINRPSYGDLNPFRFYSSKYNYSEGNPFLQPFYMDNVDFSLTYKNYFGSLYANYLTNGFDQVTFVSSDNPIQKVIPYNFYKQLNVGTIQYYSFNKWYWLESNNVAIIYYSQTTSDLANTLPKIDQWTMSFNSNNSFVLNNEKTLRAELNFTYQSPSVAGSYNLSSYYYFDAGIKYSLLDKKLQIGLTATDIFRTNEQTFTQVVNGIKQQNYDYRDAQKIRLSLVWDFGKSIKVAQREQSNEDEKGRAN